MDVDDPSPGRSELSAEEVRVLGCLLEKQRTTPDDYPLTANAVMRAANQTTSRHPVVDYDQRTVERALTELKAAGLVRFVHLPSGRATTKYRHVLDEMWGLDEAELAVLGLLFLRGPQAAGELRTRADRWHPFASPGAVREVLERLAERPEPFVRELERQVGHRDAWWVHLVGGEPDPESADPPSRPTSAGGVVGERLAELEAVVAELQCQMADLRAQLGLDDPAVGGEG